MIENIILKEIHEKYTQIWNKNKKQYIDEVFSPNVNYIFDALNLKGIDAIKAHAKEWASIFKNPKYIIQDVIYAENKIIQRWQGTETFVGIYGNLRATNKEFTYNGLTLLIIKNNKIQDVWIYSNIKDVLEKESFT